MGIGIADCAHQAACFGVTRNYNRTAISTRAQPGLRVEHEATHGRFQFGGMAAVTLTGQYRTDLFFKQFGASRLRIERRCGEKHQPDFHCPPRTGALRIQRKSALGGFYHLYP